MASRGPSFNSRVRDYRRNLWGEGAPLVRQGILGVRNMDVTVRERRRYTDILRESQSNLDPKSSSGSSSIQKAPSATAIDRIKADIEKVAPSATRRNDDGTFAPIFVSRLRDAYLGSRAAVFECQVAGSPAPSVQWTFQGRNIQSDEKTIIEQSTSICRLTIVRPLPYDLGEYTCTATNEFGSDKTTSRLISGEAPSRPGRPECELSSDTELFVTWEAPEGPTYLEGITYRLEYRPAESLLATDLVLDFRHLQAELFKHTAEEHIPAVPVTVQSDIWGLGIITFCLLCGFHPFTSEYDRHDEIKENVLNVKCDPNLIPVAASQESLSFVTWALKKSPVRRMRTDEALSHRFLSTNPSMVRRREAVKYSASRLRKTAQLTRQEQVRPISNELENKYGAKKIQ